MKGTRAVALAALFPAAVLAQEFAIRWFTVDGGGGSSSGGAFRVSGTIGQRDAGTMGGGDFRVTGGFWALPVAVQTTNAPLLAITAVAQGFATISWQPAEREWVLQERASLETGAWTNAPSGGQNPVTVPATLPVKFYRLSRP